jgi:esterase
MLAYTERGSGQQPVVLLHGFLGSGRNLASLARLWAGRDPDVRIVLPDLTGHGASPPLGPGADLGSMASDVLELMANLGLPAPITLVGHSLGGRVALVVRHVSPERIGSLTLLDVAPGPLPREGNELTPVAQALLAAPAQAESREQLRAFFAARGIGRKHVDWLLMNLAPAASGGVRWRIDRQALGAFAARTQDVDLWPALEAARRATACIRGGASRFVSDADVERLEATGVLVQTIADAGHFVHVDAQQAVLDILTRFHKI